jgi:hypothetical protein
MANAQKWLKNGVRRPKRIRGYLTNNGLKWYKREATDAGDWSGGKIGAGYLLGTSRSISAPVFIKWRNYKQPTTQTEADFIQKQLYNISIDETEKIMKQKYWDAIGGDQLKSQLIAEMAADMRSSAGNNGVKALQRAAGVTPDGNVGKLTIDAINAADEGKLYNKYREEMLKFYRGAKSSRNYDHEEDLNEDYPPYDKLDPSRKNVADEKKKYSWLIGLLLAVILAILIYNRKKIATLWQT